MNKLWHEEHPRDRQAPPLKQVAWHEAHQKYCGCSPVPAHIQRMMPPSATGS